MVMLLWIASLSGAYNNNRTGYYFCGVWFIIFYWVLQVHTPRSFYNHSTMPRLVLPSCLFGARGALAPASFNYNCCLQVASMQRHGRNFALIYMLFLISYLLAVISILCLTPGHSWKSSSLFISTAQAVQQEVFFGCHLWLGTHFKLIYSHNRSIPQA